MTKQSEKDKCDINLILKRHNATGQISHLARNPQWGVDFPDAIEFQEALNTVTASNLAFNQLSSDIRERFANDPFRMFAFLDDEKNRDEAIRLGLVPKPPASPEPEPPRPPESGGGAGG